MKTSELNRDIRRLNSEIKKNSATGGHQYIESYAKKEFKRLYAADNQFIYMNKQSVLIMLRLNLRYRFVPLHQFGLYIEI